MPKSMKARVDALTPRQREVVRLVSLGCTLGEIAAVLDVAESTVSNHKMRIMQVLGTDKSVLLTRIAIKHGLSRLDDKLTRTEKRKSGRSRDGWN